MGILCSVTHMHMLVLLEHVPSGFPVPSTLLILSVTCFVVPTCSIMFNSVPLVRVPPPKTSLLLPTNHNLHVYKPHFTSIQVEQICFDNVNSAAWKGTNITQSIDTTPLPFLHAEPLGCPLHANTIAIIKASSKWKSLTSLTSSLL